MGTDYWPIDKCRESGLAMVLVAVGAAGARAEIAEFMSSHNLAEGEDYLFVA